MSDQPVISPDQIHEFVKAHYGAIARTAECRFDSGKLLQPRRKCRVCVLWRRSIFMRTDIVRSRTAGRLARRCVGFVVGLWRSCDHRRVA